MRESRVTLSEREREILKRVSEGLSNKEISVTMRITPSTVKRHVENILKKLGVRNRIQAAVYAVTKLT